MGNDLNKLNEKWETTLPRFEKQIKELGKVKELGKIMSDILNDEIIDITDSRLDTIVSSDPIKHYRMFEIRYLSATDNNDPRLKIVDERNHKSKILGKDYNYDVGRDQVIDYLKSIGIEATGFSVTDEKDFIFTRDFVTKLK